jgi:arylsulfatase A-like enzyme
MIRAIFAGIAFGLCAAAVDTFFGGLQMMRLNMPPLVEMAAEGAAYTLGLGALFGLVLSPLRLLWKGWIVHALAMAAAWAALARYVALDPARTETWLMAPAIGLGILALGALVARKSRLLAWALGFAMLTAAVAMPVVVDPDREQSVAASPTGTAPAGAPDVVLVVLDTVRATNVSAYGYERATTPTFDRLADESALFLDASAPSTWSLPSHASLFTGLFPSGHGAHGEHRVLTPDVPTLAEVLGANGFETQCFTANPHISDGFGLTRGFQQQDRAWAGPNAGQSFRFIYRVLDLVGVGPDDKGGGRVVDNFEHWLALRPDDGPPAFAFLNFLEAHFPYHQTPPRFLARYTELGPLERRDVSMKAMAAQFGRDLTDAEADAIAGPSIDMYDAGVSYSDFLLERVVDALREAKRLDRTLLVVVSDHGEMIGEHHEFGHGPGLYQPVLRVPLLLRYPNRIPAGIRVARPVSTAGVYASVLDLVGIAPPRRPHVASLLPVLVGKRGGEPVLAERFANHDFPTLADSAPLAKRDRRYRVYRRGNEKLAVTSEGDRFVFDLDTDPSETVNLAERDPAATAQLVAELETWVSALGLPPIDQVIEPSAEVVADPVAAERLRALGYVD